MTASSRSTKTSYISRFFEVVVGRCQRESALKPLIFMAAFVTNSEVGDMFSTNYANKHHGYVCSN